MIKIPTNPCIGDIKIEKEIRGLFFKKPVFIVYLYKIYSIVYVPAKKNDWREQGTFSTLDKAIMFVEKLKEKNKPVLKTVVMYIKNDETNF